MKETMIKVNKTKSWFFEKIKKIDKPLARLIKNKREKNQISKIRNEKKELTTDNAEIQRNIRDYYEQSYGNKIDNLEEMDRILEKFNLPSLTQEEIEMMNNRVTSTEIESVIKNLPKNKSPRPGGFTRKFYQTFSEELMPILLKFCQKKLQRKEHVQTHSTSPPSPRYQNQTKTTTKKENYSPIPLINIDAKIFNTILANRIQQDIKKLIYHDKVGFIPGMQVFLNICKSINVIHNVNKSKDKNYMIISIDAEFKIQHPFMIKTLQKIVI